MTFSPTGSIGRTRRSSPTGGPCSSSSRELDELLRQARDGRRREVRRAPPGPRQAPRPRAHRALLDRDSPFLELSPLAAWGSDFTIGASVVTGVGVVHGVECVVVANDPTVRGGTSNPYTLKKSSAHSTSPSPTGCR